MHGARKFVSGRGPTGRGGVPRPVTVEEEILS